MKSTGPSLGILNAPLGLCDNKCQTTQTGDKIDIPDLSEEYVDDKSPEQEE